VVELDEVTAIEDRYAGGGEPVLGDAFAALRGRWQAGATDRETLLRLMFLAWYSCSEPEFLTGLPRQPDGPRLFASVFDQLGGESTTDSEVAFVVSVMASSFPECLGDEAAWTALAARLTERVGEQVHSDGLAPERFEGRGAYGQYFAHIVRRLRA
jgi:hypothetical protein